MQWLESSGQEHMKYKHFQRYSCHFPLPVLGRFPVCSYLAFLCLKPPHSFTVRDGGSSTSGGSQIGPVKPNFEQKKITTKMYWRKEPVSDPLSSGPQEGCVVVEKSMKTVPYSLTWWQFLLLSRESMCGRNNHLQFQ